ncbi:MAG: hypothetical protein ACK4IK_06350 [Bacteroidia bacterium]
MAEVTNYNKMGGEIEPPIYYIPVDFLKAEVIGLHKEYFFNNRCLVFTPVIKKGTSEELNYEYLEHKNLKLKVYTSGRITLSGSLHKYYNGGMHNYNDFNAVMYQNVLDEINIKFGILPENLRILQIEYGVNINPEIPTDEVLKGLLQHKRKDFELKISNDRGKYYQVMHEQYIIKIYDKAKQYKLDKKILRIEIKQTNWSKYRLEKKLITLKDFNDVDKQLFLSNLLQKWDEVLFYDSTITTVNRWHKYSNINFWQSLIKKSVSNKTFAKHRNKLKEINQKFGLNIQNRIYNLIKEKVHSLQGVTNFMFSNFKEENKKKCKLTGVDISIQRDDSFLLSHKGLKHLISQDYFEFERMRELFLPPQYWQSDAKTQIKRIAHNIRSRYNYRDKSEINQLSIFDNCA